MARTKAFTLVEFLIATAILALLATVLFPIVAQARAAADGTATATNLRQIGAAANLYSNDYDGQVVRTHMTSTDTKNYWAVQLTRYTGTTAVFFDPTRGTPTGSTVTLGGIPTSWWNATSLSINDSGYSGYWNMVGSNTCAGRRSSYVFGRSVSAIANPAQRVAFAPTTYAGTNFGWNYFTNYQANWLSLTTPVTTFSWNNLVYNTNTLYTGGKIPVVHADGSAGTLTRGNFTDLTASPTMAAYCAWMSTDGQATWGPYWNGS